MKHTKEETELLKSLSKSEVGRQLALFIDHLCSHIADARNWGENDTKESVLMAVNTLQTELRNKISQSNTTPNKAVFRYE